MNVKEEVLKGIEGRKLLCASIEIGDGFFVKPVKKFNLPIGYTQKDLQQFLNNLDFEVARTGYFSTRQLYGYLWHSETTWSERCTDEYERWEYYETPKIPLYLRK